MLYTVRRLSFRLHREIDAANNPSRGRRRRHCSVMPAAPLRRGMEGGKEHPGTYYNRPYEGWFCVEWDIERDDFFQTSFAASKNPEGSWIVKNVP